MLKKKSAGWRITILAIILIVIIFSIICFINAGIYLNKKDRLTKADAIVVLMGPTSGDRILQAVDLYDSGYAHFIIIATESMGNNRALEQRGIHLAGNTEQCSQIAKSLGVPASNIIILPGNAQSTQDEAVAVRKYLTIIQDTGHSSLVTGHWSLVIVTSSEHTRRASWIFKKALNTRGLKTKVMVSPSKYSAFTGKGWWKEKESMQLVVSEYVKMLNFLLIEQFKL